MARRARASNPCLHFIRSLVNKFHSKPHVTYDGSEPKLSGLSITFSDMSFVEDNSLGNVLRYARMMHGDFAVSGLGPTSTHTTHCHWAVVRRRYRQLLTCLGVISKHITQGWGRLNFNGLIFGQVGNRSLSDKPNGPDRHLCQLRGLGIS